MTKHTPIHADPKALRLELAQRRRALLVNSGIYSRHHGVELKSLLGGRAGGSARREAGGLVQDLGATRDWTPATRVGVRRTMAALRRAAIGLGEASPTRERLDWHRARLGELLAQDAAIVALAQAAGVRRISLGGRPAGRRA